MPTPVSALIHAATLVTAGIYLLLRSSWILEYSPLALIVILLVGSITAIFAATSGLVQNDIKRISATRSCNLQWGVIPLALVNGLFLSRHAYLVTGMCEARETM